MVYTEINPVDVIFVVMADGHSVGKKFPAFYKSKYKSNPDELVKSTLENGFLEEIIDYREGLAKSKVTKLKMILKSYKLNITGRKAELINRILENVPQKELKDMFEEKQYQITSKGKKFIKDNDFALIYHNTKVLSNYISLEDYYELCLENPRMSAAEVLVDFFRENSEFHLEFKNWDNYVEIQEMLYTITKDLKYKCLISFVGINFLNSKFKQAFPKQDEVILFKEIFSREVKIFYEYSPKYSTRNTLNIILSAAKNENKKTPDKKDVKIKTENHKKSSSTHDFVIRQVRPINMKTENVFPIALGIIGLVVLIYFYLNF